MMRKAMECLFDLLYLLFILGTGVAMLAMFGGRRVAVLFGAMALVLGAGDAIHLVPRMCAAFEAQPRPAVLGAGKLAASITSTVYYLLLYYVWRGYYADSSDLLLTMVVWGLVIVRVALCCLPRNRWFGGQPDHRWGVYRNLPFFALGLVMVVLFSVVGEVGGPPALRPMSVAVALSFAFYAPVVFLGERRPKVGMLMMPKTLMYCWIQVMGLLLVLG